MAVAKKRTASVSEEGPRAPHRIGREPIPIPRLVPRGKTAFDTVTWKTHDAVIKNAEGKVIFELKGIHAPASWSENSINIAASKYFRVIQGRRENSVDGMIRRVCHWMGQKGLELGYFDTPEEATQLEESLSYLMVQQMAAFNSPVWFNVGVRQPPQCSACFIQSVSDDMDSILALAASEGRLFKGGSGTGSNLSALRGSHERLSGGGIASRPRLVHARVRRARGRHQVRAGRPAAPRRWSSSTWTTPTSWTSSSARSARRTRRWPSSARDIRRTSTAPTPTAPTPRSPTRTRTTRSASRTRSWTPS